MNKVLLSAAAASCLLLASAAHAQACIGIAGGPGKISDSCEDTTSCDTTSSGYKLFGGCKFNPNLAGELVVMDFGKAKATANAGLGPIRLEIKARAIGLDIAYVGDLAPSVPFTAPLGVASVKAQAKGNVGSFSTSDSESSTQADFGLSVGYAFSSSLSLDVGYDYNRAKLAGGTDPVHLFSVGLTSSL
jgi:OmpA-OmpF porin, OOP family